MIHGTLETSQVNWWGISGCVRWPGAIAHWMSGKVILGGGEIRIEISSMGRCQSQKAQERTFWAEEMSRAKTLRVEKGLAHSKNRKSPGSLGLWLSEQGGGLWKSQQAVQKHVSLALGTAGEN